MRQTACTRRFLPAMIGGGTWEGAHARHEAAGVRRPVRRRGRVAARGACTAAVNARVIGVLGIGSPELNAKQLAITRTSRCCRKSSAITATSASRNIRRRRGRSSSSWRTPSGLTTPTARNAVYPRGHHGNVILSKFPILSYDHENLSTNAMEHRGLLHCVIEVPGTGRKLHIVCLHLGLTQRGRNQQLDQICRRIGRLPATDPVIVGGDFNDWRGRVSPVLFERHGLREAHETAHGRKAKTFPIKLPLLSVDRIYSRGFEREGGDRARKGSLPRALGPRGGDGDARPEAAVGRRRSAPVVQRAKTSIQ